MHRRGGQRRRVSPRPDRDDGGGNVSEVGNSGGDGCGHDGGEGAPGSRAVGVRRGHVSPPPVYDLVNDSNNSFIIRKIDNSAHQSIDNSVGATDELEK